MLVNQLKEVNDHAIWNIFFGSESKPLSRTQINQKQTLEVEQMRREGQQIPKASFRGNQVRGGTQYGAFSKTREGKDGNQEVVLSSKAFLNTASKAFQEYRDKHQELPPHDIKNLLLLLILSWRWRERSYSKAIK